MKVLAIIEASTVTGPAKNLLQFAQLARPLGVDIRVVTFHRAGDSSVFLEAAERAGVTVQQIEEQGRFDRSVVPALRETFRQFQPALVQTHAVKSHLLARLAGLKPWIAYHHGYTWPDLRTRIYNQADRWSLRKAAAVLTVSQPFAEQLRGMGVRGDRIQVVHNAINPNWGNAKSSGLRAALGIGENKTVVLIVGRLSKEKDHITLLEAVRDLPVHVLIVGEGPERGRIEEFIRTYGKQDAVTMTGQVPSAEPYYAVADIAALSSLSEGSPNALLEAMAAGVPVVATTVGGIPEIVTNGESALLVEAGDRQAMTAAIANLLENRDLARRLVQRARQLIATKYCPEKRAARICAIYQDVLK